MYVRLKQNWDALCNKENKELMKERKMVSETEV